MTTSSPIFRHQARGFPLSRILVASFGIVLAVALFAAGFAQTVFPAVRSALADVYVGVPGWFFILGGLYQTVAAALMIWPRTRVTGAMHAGAISLVAIGFNVFGNGTIGIIPINIALAAMAFFVAWFFTSDKQEVEAVNEGSRRDGQEIQIEQTRKVSLEMADSNAAKALATSGRAS